MRQSRVHRGRLSVSAPAKHVMVYYLTKRQIRNDAFAKEHGADNGGNGNCYWWLRSPGNDSGFAAHVDGGGFEF